MNTHFYRCSECNANDVKLWRPRESVQGPIPLKCSRCLGYYPQHPINSEGLMGVISNNNNAIVPTNCLGENVPAIPLSTTSNGFTEFYGFSDIPENAYNNWKKLLS